MKVYVTDTGCGIAKEKLPLIFNRFEKLNDFVQGTGLGLPICQSIVERLGGKISVESEVGVGSTFVMTLPYRQFVLGADGEPVEINAHVERRSDGRKKILIAEDTESNFMQINILLKKDYTISWVTNGEEAVNSFLARASRPDIDGHPHAGDERYSGYGKDTYRGHRSAYRCGDGQCFPDRTTTSISRRMQ